MNDLPTTRYPDLMRYIEDRSTVADWCGKLREDEREALAGGFAEVVADLEAAQADNRAAKEAAGHDGYPYNGSMGLFLGLPLRSNHEPPHGYYMASCLMHIYRLGVAQRAAEDFIRRGRPLNVVAARSKADRKPIRFYRFWGPGMIQIEGDSVKLKDSKRTIRLSSNWSRETCIEALVAALRDGTPYGEGVRK